MADRLATGGPTTAEKEAAAAAAAAIEMTATATATATTADGTTTTTKTATTGAATGPDRETEMQQGRGETGTTTDAIDPDLATGVHEAVIATTTTTIRDAHGTMMAGAAQGAMGPPSAETVRLLQNQLRSENRFFFSFCRLALC